MNPHRAYQQSRSVGWTRIDMLMALFDGAIDRLEKATEALILGADAAARQALVRTKLIVTTLASGVDPTLGDVPQNLIRLYEFVLFQIDLGKVENLREAVKLLGVIREGFLAIRHDAVKLENDGVIPPLKNVGAFEAIA